MVGVKGGLWALCRNSRDVSVQALALVGQAQCIRRGGGLSTACTYEHWVLCGSQRPSYVAKRRVCCLPCCIVTRAYALGYSFCITASDDGTKSFHSFVSPQDHLNDVVVNTVGLAGESVVLSGFQQSIRHLLLCSSHMPVCSCALSHLPLAANALMRPAAGVTAPVHVVLHCRGGSGAVCGVVVRPGHSHRHVSVAHLGVGQHSV